MSPDLGRERRWRAIPELTPFELAPLLGDGASARDLQRLAETLASSYALEQRLDGVWRVVGCTGREARAQEWVDQGGEPEHEC